MMTLRELIDGGLLKDDDIIVINRSVKGTVKSVIKGNWYQDHVLECMDAEIFSLSYSEGRGWYINLNRDEEE